MTPAAILKIMNKHIRLNRKQSWRVVSVYLDGLAVTLSIGALVVALVMLVMPFIEVSPGMVVRYDSISIAGDPSSAPSGVAGLIVSLFTILLSTAFFVVACLAPYFIGREWVRIAGAVLSGTPWVKSKTNIYRLLLCVTSISLIVNGFMLIGTAGQEVLYVHAGALLGCVIACALGYIGYQIKTHLAR